MDIQHEMRRKKRKTSGAGVLFWTLYYDKRLRGRKLQELTGAAEQSEQGKHWQHSSKNHVRVRDKFLLESEALEKVGFVPCHCKL